MDIGKAYLIVLGIRIVGTLIGTGLAFSIGAYVVGIFKAGLDDKKRPFYQPPSEIEQLINLAFGFGGVCLLLGLFIGYWGGIIALWWPGFIWP